jgi:hypothetical protein
MEQKLQLKRPIKSKKFNITFPSNTPLNVMKSDNTLFVEHPNHKNLYVRVTEKNIKKGYQFKLF